MILTAEDAEEILARVRAERAHPKPPFQGGKLMFWNRRVPVEPAKLSAIEEEQLIAAGADGMGEARTAAGWLDPNQESYYGDLEVWDVVDEGGRVAYSVWIYLTDNATIFRGGTSQIVGGASQGGIECAEFGLRDALLDAKSRADTKQTLLRFIG